MKRKSCSFSILAFALLLAPFILSCASTPPIRGADSKRLPGSVSEIVKIKLGGVDQWILLRGQDIANPVALYLHGGPGGALMPLVRHYTGELERHAIMAVWDQRGAGKSYSKKIPIESMKISQYLSDAHELVAYLKKRFNKKKIFLIGHSWGSILGMKLIQRHPEDFHAFVGIGQVVNNQYGNERISWEYAYRQAKKYNNAQAIRELEEIGPPVEGFYKTDFEGGKFTARGLWRQRKWLRNFGGIMHFDSDDYDANIKKVRKMTREGMRMTLCSGEWTLADVMRARRGKNFSIEHVWPEVLKVNLIRDVPRVEVPVYFFTGRSDYNTPFELVERYHKTLQAPHKEIVWFEKSGHMLIIEEPEKFTTEMMRVISENSGRAAPVK